MKSLLGKPLAFLYRKLSELAYDTMQPHFYEDFQCDPVMMAIQLSGTSEDWHGRRDKGKKDLGNTFSWERFFKKPLVTSPGNLAEIDSFLKGCRYMSDQETRGCEDFWEPPDIFEERRTGDCEDHAIWAWRQLHTLGYKSRLVIGDCRGGHAWVHVFVNDRVYLLETTHKTGGLPVAKQYKPFWSVQRMSNKKFAIYSHRPPGVYPFPL